jgi:hypothetical protein
MSFFETLSKFMEMGNDPKLMEAADGIGKAASQIPDLLKGMLAELEQIKLEMQGMRMDLDRLADPIKRPPFSAQDVQAAMDGIWPPENSPEAKKAQSDGLSPLMLSQFKL